MSNEKKYTPGPWDAKHGRTLIHIGPVDNGGFVATLSRHAVMPKEVHEANARLIAAAPELLEALEEVVEYHEGRGKYNFSKLPDEERANAAYDAWQDIWRKKIHPAIAKAHGE